MARDVRTGLRGEIRGDIQGLRAIAVLSVIAAHAGVPFLQGGFVGVDVFYVVSGYLISGLLYREVEAHGRFSLTAFWVRRARRILPAATLVTVATVVGSLVWLSLVDARQVVVDALWASAFAANVHVAQQGVDYFASDAGPAPLQHYWSLAVEEQFYVVWPLLLLACLAGRRVLGGSGLPKRTILAVLTLLTAASLAWSVWSTASAPESAYFSTFARGWEIGVGAIAALLGPRAARQLTRRAAALLAGAGTLAVLVAAVLYSDAVAFPGYAAALPVAGTALLLVAGASGHPTGTGRLLSTPPLRRLGDWSYSLYLWHWPVLVLAPAALGRDLTVPELVAAVLLVVALAALTHDHVETPFRSGREPRRRVLLLYPACLALVAASAGGAWLWTDARSDRGDQPAITLAAAPEQATPQAVVQALVRASVEAGRQQRAVPGELTPDVLDVRDSVADVGDCDYTQDVRRLCPRGDPDGTRTVVVVGDSHARAWIPAFDEMPGWRAFYLVKPQCVAAHVSVAAADTGKPFAACADFQRWVVDQVTRLHPDLVVVASSPPVNGVFDGRRRVTTVAGTAPLLRAGYDDLFRELGAAADRVALLRDVPKSETDPATCLTTGRPSLGTCMFTPDARSRVLGDVAVDAARAAGVAVVDPTPWLCWQDQCPVVIGDTLPYRDTDHLTTQYAAGLARPLGSALGMTAASS